MNRLSLFKRKKRKTASSSESEVQQLTAELIDETCVGLQKRFEELLAEHTEPLSKEDACVILNCLIKEAVAKRQLLAGRIEKNVETGSLFDRYYGKMQTINVLTNSAYARMQKMDKAKEKYEYECAVYKKLTGKMYEPDVLPNEPKKSRSSAAARGKDAWQIMDERKNVIEEE